MNDRHRSTRKGLGCAPSSGSIFGTPIGNRRSRPSVQARVTPRSSAKPSTKPMTERRLPDFEAGRTSYYPWAKADLLSRSRRIGRHRQAGCRGVSGRFSRILCPVRLQRQQMARISIAICASDVSQGEEGSARRVRVWSARATRVQRQRRKPGPADRGLPRSVGSTTMVCSFRVQGNGPRRVWRGRHADLAYP